MYGFPLNSSFVDYDKIWEDIKATSIHEIMRNDIDFFVSVGCFEYPSFIISTWVFIGVLIDEY